MAIGKMIGKIIAKIKNRYFCDHVYEVIRYLDEPYSNIQFKVCIKCGKVKFGDRKKFFLF